MAAKMSLDKRLAMAMHMKKLSKIAISFFVLWSFFLIHYRRWTSPEDIGAPASPFSYFNTQISAHQVLSSASDILSSRLHTSSPSDSQTLHLQLDEGYRPLHNPASSSPSISVQKELIEDTSLGNGELQTEYTNNTTGTSEVAAGSADASQTASDKSLLTTEHSNESSEAMATDNEKIQEDLVTRQEVTKDISEEQDLDITPRNTSLNNTMEADIILKPIQNASSHAEDDLGTSVYVTGKSSQTEITSENVVKNLPSCQGRRIYMYDLPAEFNYKILEQCDRNITGWLNFCPHIENEGLGRAIANEPGWYGTDPYMLEVIFHRRMKEYKCLANSQEEADAFFIPYYSGLDALRFLYGKEYDRRNEQGIELVKWLEQNGGPAWRRVGGLDHFIVMGRTAWDFCQPHPNWGTKLREFPSLANVTALFLESRIGKPNEQAVPYPTSFHPASVQELQDWIETVRVSKRTSLVTFVGAPRGGPVGSIRKAVLEQCLMTLNDSLPSASPSYKSLCSIVDCSTKMKCSHNPIPIREALLNSEFCLQPPGDSPTRRSAFDALIAGCIPVFFREDSFYQQYTWHIPSHLSPHDFSVFIPADELLFHYSQKNSSSRSSNIIINMPSFVHQVLLNYTKETISNMRQNILHLIPSLIFNNPSSSSSSFNLPDAFDTSLRGFLQKLVHMKSSM